jgi:hypothetical protein
MHRAPAVTFTLKRSRWQLRLIACLSALAFAALVAFGSGQSGSDHRTALLALAIVCATLVAYLGWKRSEHGDLRWDGQYWIWSGYGENLVCHLRLLMDFQGVVVVSVHAKDQAPVFLWLEKTNGDSNWSSLRRAIVSSHANDAGTSKDARPGIVGDSA